MNENPLLATIRRADQEIIVPVLAEVRDSSIADDNTVLDFDQAPTKTLQHVVDELAEAIPAPYFTFGHRYLAIVKPAFLRIPREHGIFLWTTRYRAAADGRTLLAAPFVMYRMAYDGRLHAFGHRFVTSRDGLPIEELQKVHIRQHLLDSFCFYKVNADSERRPW